MPSPGYTFGTISRDNLLGVLAPLRQVAERAIMLSEIDFRIIEGRRSQIRQAQLVEAGASRTLDGRHVTGHAIDVAALVGGFVRWDWPLYPVIAEAFRAAARELTISIVWGAVWDRPLHELVEPLDEEAVGYSDRWRKAHPGSKRGPLVDGPHFELWRAAYPPPAVTSTPPLPGGAA